MKFFHSLRFKLSFIYLLTIFIPSIIIAYAVPTYYQNRVSKEREILTQGTLSAISRNIDTYLDDLEKLTLMPYSDSKFINALKAKANKEYYEQDPYNIYLTEKDINSSLTVSLNNIRQDIRSVMLIPNDNSTYFYDRYLASATKPGYDFKSQSWYKEAIRADGRAAFINFHPQDYIYRTSVTNVFSVARVIKEPDTQKNLAVIMADADNLIIDRILKDANFGVSSIVAIFDNEYNLIYSTSVITHDMKNQILNYEEIIKGKNDTYMPVSKYLNRADWNMVVLLSKSETTSKIRVIYLSAILFVVVQILLAFSLFYFLSRSITNRFGKIKMVMDQAKKGNLEARFFSKAKDEVSVVGFELNNMIEQIGDLIDSEYKAVLNRRNAEYYALQSQIQPHFLYNTLNGFIGLNRLGKKDILEKAIFSLTGMLRYILDHSEWSTIKEEFTLLERYCTLQKIRFEDRLNFNINFDESISDFKIPKLLVQPLVENAIIHGIEPMDNCGEVNISGLKVREEDKEYIIILVIDNGVGFDFKSHSYKNSIGLKNIRERLDLAFNNASFIIDSSIGNGTKAFIKICIDMEGSL